MNIFTLKILMSMTLGHRPLGKQKNIGSPKASGIGRRIEGPVTNYSFQSSLGASTIKNNFQKKQKKSILQMQDAF